MDVRLRTGGTGYIFKSTGGTRRFRPAVRLREKWFYPSSTRVLVTRQRLKCIGLAPDVRKGLAFPLRQLKRERHASNWRLGAWPRKGREHLPEGLSPFGTIGR
jgi:hypothetical protein